MFAGIRLEQLPEVGAAGTEHDLMRGEAPLVAGQGHVHKVLLLAQVAERGEDRGLKVVPLERVLLFGRRGRHGRLHFVVAAAAAEVAQGGGLVQESSVGGTAVVSAMVLMLLLSRRRCRRMQES